jgi:hypothetical protein
MPERGFILEIQPGAYERTVKSIGEKLLDLDSTKVHSGTRSMEAVLSDMLQGIRDKVLLRTSLDPHELEKLLKQELGSDFKQCRIEWMANV